MNPDPARSAQKLITAGIALCLIFLATSALAYYGLHDREIALNALLGIPFFMWIISLGYSKRRKLPPKD